MTENNSFKKGIKDGLPICLGYISVAFAFGIFASEAGLSILQTLLISMTNVTSAGQLASVPIIVSGGALAELAISQLVINLRYALMSVSLSQKLGPTVRWLDRFIIAFVNTDEVFAVSASNKSLLGRNYMFGLILMPFLGWSLGTFLGSAAGSLLPSAVCSALGIAIYAMFVAIVVPEMSKRTATFGCVILAVLLSCAFKYIPALSGVQQGFVIIISACISSVVFALVSPIEIREEALSDE